MAMITLSIGAPTHVCLSFNTKYLLRLPLDNISTRFNNKLVKHPWVSQNFRKFNALDGRAAFVRIWKLSLVRMLDQVFLLFSKSANSRKESGIR